MQDVDILRQHVPRSKRKKAEANQMQKRLKRFVENYAKEGSSTEALEIKKSVLFVQQERDIWKVLDETFIQRLATGEPVESGFALNNLFVNILKSSRSSNDQQETNVHSN